ncbi:MAG: 3,4-dihydroxy-2-butanone-4-phosphate synthase [Candidatus Aenigmarchaeota archaeon]|nr:3,4-dihydroxy-2-butanone-4-phosphate synthase [Candidatus Aenigmarchaeota archaeon]
MKVPPWRPVPEAVARLRGGGVVVLVDGEDRENEGDLVLAAQYATPEKVNFMLQFGRGLLCVPLEATRARALGLPPMVAENTSPLGCAFTVSVDSRHGTTTGISAQDRAATIKRLALPKAVPQDFHRPGHVFPLIAHPRLLEGRQGHTEGAIALARAAGLFPAAAICEVLREDGSMARFPELQALSQQFGLPLIRIADLRRQVRQGR